MDSSSYKQAVRNQYKRFWPGEHSCFSPQEGRWRELALPFDVVMVKPAGDVPDWRFGSCGFSRLDQTPILEIHMVLRRYSDVVPTIFAAAAHYHQTESQLDVGHIVNFGAEIEPRASCLYGLFSRPYLYGPDFEWCDYRGEKIRCLWLLPITSSERDFAIKNGVTALEELFEENHLQYWDPCRNSVI